MESEKIIKRLLKCIGKDLISYKSVPGGLTNETYVVCDRTDNYIARIAGEGTESIIDRDAELFNMLVGAKIGISPKVYASVNGSYLMEYIPSPTIRKEAELQSGKTLCNFIEALNILHNSREDLYNTYDIVDNIKTYKAELAHMKIEYPSEFIKEETPLFDMTEMLQEKYMGKIVPCHVDNIFGNIINLPDRAVLIDWEYSGMSDEYCDLANFSLLNDLSSETEMLFLNKYFESNNSKCNYKKYFLFKMAINYMWVYWHLIKLNQGKNVEYNSRRWRERLCFALESKKRFEEID